MNRREQETVQQIGVEFCEGVAEGLGVELSDEQAGRAGDAFLDTVRDALDELLAQAWESGLSASLGTSVPPVNPYVSHPGAAQRPGDASKATVRESHGCDSKGRENGTQPLSPDCRDGKCRPCAGDAWDETTDQPADCGCDCHKEETK